MGKPHPRSGHPNVQAWSTRTWRSRLPCSPLLDSGAGSGKLLDVASVKVALENDDHLSVMLAGGLNAENVVESVAALGSLAGQVFAVDVSSGVEENGKQSLEKIRSFIKAAKSIR